MDDGSSYWALWLVAAFIGGAIFGPLSFGLICLASVAWLYISL